MRLSEIHLSLKQKIFVGLSLFAIAGVGIDLLGGNARESNCVEGSVVHAGPVILCVDKNTKEYRVFFNGWDEDPTGSLLVSSGRRPR